MSPSSLSASKNDGYFGYDNDKELSQENDDFTRFTRQRQSFDIKYDHEPKQENGMFPYDFLLKI